MNRSNLPNNDPQTTKPQALLLLGPTASGKTPLGELIERHGLCGTQYVHFDFGDNLREIVARDQPDGHVTREDIDFLHGVLKSGALLEDKDFHIARHILESFLDRQDVGRHTWTVLNGLPRHAGQARGVDAILDVQTVIHLQCSAEVVLTRIRNNTGGDRSRRTDDDAAFVRRKLTVYHERTAPLLDHYARQGAQIETLEVTADTTPHQMHDALQSRSRLRTD